MNDDFQRRVRAAAMAGWCTVVVGAGLVILSWLAYLAVLSARPSWLLSLWGPDLDWGYVQNVWFRAIVIFKMVVWLMALVALWLTLWARWLRAPGRS
jgi:hypothetical protein